MDKLGTYLKNLRIKQGLSLKDVYKQTGISDSRLSRIEKGSRTFESAPAIIKVLASLYGIDLVDLLLDTGYLDTESLSSYEQVFRNVNLLSDEEKNHIQKQIDLFTKGREVDDI